MSKIKDQLSRDEDYELEMWLGYADYIASVPEPTDDELCHMEEESKKLCSPSVATQPLDSNTPDK